MAPGTTTLTSSLEAEEPRVPVFARGGLVLPVQEPGLTTAASRTNPMTLIVFLGEDGAAEGDLYLDDGESIMEEDSEEYWMASKTTDADSSTTTTTKITTTSTTTKVTTTTTTTTKPTPTTTQTTTTPTTKSTTTTTITASTTTKTAKTTTTTTTSTTPSTTTIPSKDHYSFIQFRAGPGSLQSDPLVTNYADLGFLLESVVVAGVEGEVTGVMVNNGLHQEWVWHEDTSSLEVTSLGLNPLTQFTIHWS